MEEFRKHGYKKKMAVGEIVGEEQGRNQYGANWVDINKGDHVNPDYRSRLVAKEIKG